MAYPVRDLQGYLSGVWAAERRIEDRARGVVGRFTGTLDFTGSDPLVSREEGTLELPGAAPASVYRTHLWTVEGDRADVAFEDGRPFHTLSLAKGEDSPSHWCSPDQYDGRVTAQSPSDMTWLWEVRGPKKDLLITTRLSRPRPVITVSAVQLTSPDGSLLLVRKRGTELFMQPGGKPEPGESADDAAARELLEELGLRLDSKELEYLHAWRGAPANEAGFELYSENFAAVADLEGLTPAAEIEEIIVVGSEDFQEILATGIVPGTGRRAAPLLMEKIIPPLAHALQG